MDGRVAPGRLLGPRLGERYELVRVLTDGGAGELYEAVDERLQRRVAVRVVEEARKQFVQSTPYRALLSSNTASAVDSAFNSLANTVLGNNARTLEDLRRHNVAEQDLADEASSAGHGVRSPQVKALLKQQADRARDYYARAAAGLQRGDAKRLVAAQIMGAIYSSILTRIEQSDYDVFSRVARIPRPRRALIAAATWARTAVGL